jgi:TRAP-type C4-dicarboxylate transport system permease small subunit
LEKYAPRGKEASAWRVLDVTVDAICSFLCLGLTAISFAAVIWRYGFNSSLTWSEELTRYMFVWVVFLGAAIGVRQRNHIAVDLFSGRVGPRGDARLTWIERIATLAFAGFVAIPGWTFVRVGMGNLSPAMEIPMGLVYAAPVVGSLLMIVYVFRPAPDTSRRREDMAPTL